MRRKILLWDFDGTLGYRQGGMWSHALLEALLDAEPGSAATLEHFLPLLREGFPWHLPEREHTELNDPDAWWDALRSEVLEKAYHSCYEKPHPRIYEIALSRLGNPHPDHLWMIGDNVHADVLGAERVGIKAILVRKEDSRAIRQCHDLYAIPSIIHSLS